MTEPGRPIEREPHRPRQVQQEPPPQLPHSPVCRLGQNRIGEGWPVGESDSLLGEGLRWVVRSADVEDSHARVIGQNKAKGFEAFQPFGQAFEVAGSDAVSAGSNCPRKRAEVGPCEFCAPARHHPNEQLAGDRRESVLRARSRGDHERQVFPIKREAQLVRESPVFLAHDRARLWDPARDERKRWGLGVVVSVDLHNLARPADRPRSARGRAGELYVIVSAHHHARSFRLGSLLAFNRRGQAIAPQHAREKS